MASTNYRSRSKAGLIDMPDVSVIIPYFSDPDALLACLESLERQDTGRVSFEVVLVDDASAWPASSQCAQLRSQLDLRVLRHPHNRGRSAARNTGIRAARSSVILFIDADCLADPHLVRVHALHHAARRLPSVLIGRRLEVGWDFASRFSAASRKMLDELRHHFRDERDDWLASPDLARMWREVPWLYSFTSNISVSKALCDDVGGFDAKMKHWGAEDSELFYRVFVASGRDTAMFDGSLEAVCYHLPHYRDRALGKDQEALNLSYMRHKHPHFEIEALGLYGGHPAATRRISHYRKALATYLQGPALTPEGVGSELSSRLRNARALYAGRASQRLGLRPESRSLDHEAPETATNFHLIGLQLPFPENLFDVLVNVDLWRLCGPEDLTRVILEGLRVAEHVVLVSSGIMSEGPFGELERSNDVSQLRGWLRSGFVFRELDLQEGWAGVKVFRAVPSIRQTASSERYAAAL